MSSNIVRWMASINICVQELSSCEICKLSKPILQGIEGHKLSSGLENTNLDLGAFETVEVFEMHRGNEPCGLLDAFETEFQQNGNLQKAYSSGAKHSHAILSSFSAHLVKWLN